MELEAAFSVFSALKIRPSGRGDGEAVPNHFLTAFATPEGRFLTFSNLSALRLKRIWGTIASYFEANSVFFRFTLSFRLYVKERGKEGWTANSEVLRATAS